MRFWLPAQFLLIPVALLIAVLIYPTLPRFSIDETSPVFTTKQTAEHWLADKARHYHCIPTATDSETFSEYSGVDSPWFGRLECRQSLTDVKYAALVLIPWILANAIAIVALRLMRKR